MTAEQLSHDGLPEVQLFTDGGCSGNPGPGGWAFILRHPGTGKEMEKSGAEDNTTNNRMELMAVIEGLKALKRTCEIAIYTDSVYVQKGMTEWIHAWRQRGWRTSDKKPVKNEDLWRILDDKLSHSGHDIHWHWVKGHSGDWGNEQADALANQGVPRG